MTESGIVVVPKGTLVPAKGPCVLANDVAELIGNEPELRAQLRPGTFVVSMQSRHSYDSAGPRFKKFAGERPIGSSTVRGPPRLERGRAVRAVRWPRRRGRAGCPPRRPEPRPRRRRCSCRCTAASPRGSRRRASRSRPASARRSRSAPHRFEARAADRADRRACATASSTARRSTIAPAGCTARAAPASSATTTCGSRALGKAALAARPRCCSAARSTCSTSTTGRAAPAAIYAHLARRAAARSSRRSTTSPTAASSRKHVMTELGLPWSLFTLDAARVLRSGLVPEGRARALRRRHHGQPDATRRRS